MEKSSLSWVYIIYDKIFHESTMLYALTSKEYIAFFAFRKLCGMAHKCAEHQL